MVGPLAGRLLVRCTSPLICRTKEQDTASWFCSSVTSELLSILVCTHRVSETLQVQVPLLCLLQILQLLLSHLPPLHPAPASGWSWGPGVSSSSPLAPSSAFRMEQDWSSDMCPINEHGMSESLSVQDSAAPPQEGFAPNSRVTWQEDPSWKRLQGATPQVWLLNPFCFRSPQIIW